jgi:hypothetical protein
VAEDDLPLHDRFACAERVVGALLVAARMEDVKHKSVEDVLAHTTVPVTPERGWSQARRLVVARRGVLHVPYTADDRMAATLRSFGVTHATPWLPEPNEDAARYHSIAWHTRELRGWLRVVTWSLSVRHDSAMCVGAAVSLVAAVLLYGSTASVHGDVECDAATRCAWIRAAAHAIDNDVGDRNAMHVHDVPSHRTLLALEPIETLLLRFRLPITPANARHVLQKHYPADRCVQLGSFCSTYTTREHTVRCYHAGAGATFSIAGLTCALLRDWLESSDANGAYAARVGSV